MKRHHFNGKRCTRRIVQKANPLLRTYRDYYCLCFLFLNVCTHVLNCMIIRFYACQYVARSEHQLQILSVNIYRYLILFAFILRINFSTEREAHSSIQTFSFDPRHLNSRLTIISSQDLSPSLSLLVVVVKTFSRLDL